MPCAVIAPDPPGLVHRWPLPNTADEPTYRAVQPLKAPGVAARLEVRPVLCRIFGIGHRHAGSVLTGLLRRFGW